MLNGKLELHEVKDTEALCGKVIHRSGLTLTPDQHERLLTYLIETAWELSLRYQRGRGSTTTFSGYATTILRSRVVDWIRAEHGRGYRPPVLSIDHPLAEAHTRGAIDVTPDRSPDLLRVLGVGSGRAAGSEPERGEAQVDRAA